MSNWQIPFALSNPWQFDRFGLPLRCSIPLAESFVTDPERELILLNEDNQDMQAQWRVLARWPDGSARFALMDYSHATLAGQSDVKLTLQKRAAVEAISANITTIAVDETEDNITIDTGRLRWTFDRKQFNPAAAITFQDRQWAADEPWDLLAADGQGKTYLASQGEYELTVEQRGRHRAVILIRGDHRDEAGNRFLNYWMRFHFTAGGSQVLMSHHVRNREPGREGRTLQRVGLMGSLAVDDSAIRRILHLKHGLNTSQKTLDVPERVDLDTNDWETWIRNERSLRQQPEDVPYSIRGSEWSNVRACDPLIDIHEPGAGGMLMKFMMPYPHREAPLRLASESNRFEIDFFPEGGYRDEPIHLNEGMGKTRDVLLHFHDDSLDARDLFHATGQLTYPGVVGVSDEHYRAAKLGDMHKTLVKQPNKYPMVESKIEQLMDEDLPYHKVIRTSNPYFLARGWRDHGDEVGLRGDCPEAGVVQFINNEEDYIHASMLQAWRNGKPHGAIRFPRHLMDIDYIDFSEDPARDGADCPHSENHTDGETYPSHQWCQGLLYYYLATGDEEALRISKRIGDNLIWWITGPRSEALYVTGRESAWPLLSLAALHEVTAEQKYREAGLQIIDHLLAIKEKHGHVTWEYPSGSGIYVVYMLAMTFNGIWDFYCATKEERVLELWKFLSEPVIEGLDDPNSLGYVHFRNAHLRWPDLTALTHWYDLTGDERYVKLGKNGLRLFMNSCPQPLFQSPSTFAMGYRHFVFYLKLADEFGMLDDDKCMLVW